MLGMFVLASFVRVLEAKAVVLSSVVQSVASDFPKVRFVGLRVERMLDAVVDSLKKLNV